MYTYVTTVEVSPKEKCVVSCSCEDFLFTWEYTLNKKGAARIEYSNGESSKDRNPQQIPGTCIAETELISTSRGYVPIKDVIVGDSVMTKSGYHKVEQTVFMGVKNVCKVSLSDGCSLVATPDHRFLIADGRKISWKELKDIVPNKDHVIKVAGFENKKEQFGIDAARIIGYMVAEGSNLFFAGQNQNNVKDFSKRFIRYFGKDTKIRVGKNGVNIRVEQQAELDDELGFVHGSYNKEIPEWVMQGSKEEMRSFVVGAWAGDGWVSNNAATYGSVSRKLIDQMQLVLQGFGIFARITKNISGINNSTIYLLRISDRKSVNAFIREFPPVRGVNEGKQISEKLSGAALTDRLPVSKDSLKRYLATNIYKKLYEGLNGEPVYVRRMLSALGLHVDRLLPKVSRLQTAFKAPSPEGKGKKVWFAKNTDVANLIREDLIQKIERIHFKGFGKEYEWGLTKHKLQKVSQQTSVSSPEIDFLLRDDIVYVKVDKIENVGKQRVYDIAIEGEHNFLANGILVHNCKHIYSFLTRLIDKGKL
jgi:intein/homing endonuclease